MAKAKGKKRKNSKKKTKEVNKEILGIIITSLGVLSLVSMFNISTGAIGTFFKVFFATIAGKGGYVIPYIIILIGIMLIINRISKIDNKRIYSVITIFFSYLTLTHIIYFYEVLELLNDKELNFFNSLLQNIKLSISYGSDGGGGIIGSVLSYIFLNMFGTIGSYIIIASVILISVLILTNISFVKILKYLIFKLRALLKTVSDSFLNLIYIDKNNSKEFKIEGLSKTKDSFKEIKTEKSEIDQKIRILDYTKPNEFEERQQSFINKEVRGKIKEDDKNQEINVNTENKFEGFNLPKLELLNTQSSNTNIEDKTEILNKAKKLKSTLDNFGIKAKITQISKGPTITRFELQPAPGVKVSRILNLSDDIALGLAASDIRIEAPIPGKSAIGIEVPNQTKINVLLREVLESDEYTNINSNVPFALGKDIAGKPIVANIEKMPHLLIAGATGSGKSVCINTLITSILYKSKPDEVKLLMIDPKVVELGVYNGIPHLLIPVVTDPKKAAGALNWAVQEMTKRYNIFAKNGVRDISSYNNKLNSLHETEKLPQIVIIIDELADLMMVSPTEVEDYICRLAQMARAAGIHLIVATQRPSVDIITGTIKANIPSRVSFAVSSQGDSRTILGMGGAEKLLGKGDMLFYPVGASKPKRIQGAYIDESEVEKLVNYLKEQGNANYEEEIIDDIENEVDLEVSDGDELLPQAIDIVVREQQASISMLQRKLRVGYARAARLIDEMEERGIVGGHEGSKPRKVLLNTEEAES